MRGIDAACHQVRPTQPQDILNKEKQVHNPPIISQTTTYDEIRFVQSLDNLDKSKQVCSPLPIFETGCDFRTICASNLRET
ncbi:hypothetical protein KY284_010552 [Solanum tuberosum]|nr:hypothetical protein KY284_010552 [Solanum tuberosum]